MLTWRQDMRSTGDRRHRCAPDDGRGEEDEGPDTEGGRELVEGGSVKRQHAMA